MMVRYFGNKQFRCHRNGTWISLCGHYGIYHMMAGTCQSQWEVYYDEREISPEPLSGDLIGLGLTMGEAVRDAFTSASAV